MLNINNSSPREDSKNDNTNAIFGSKALGTTPWSGLFGFDEKNITYNQNGNIMTLKRNAVLSILKKQVFDNNIAGKTTDYIDGFVYENGVLANFGMREGRVRNTGTALKPEYMITDHQGNVRVSFEERGGVAVVRQENSYYPFGLIMPGSNVASPTSANNNLYNAGSEWQNDFSDLPNYYNTFFRNYDAAIGRFIGIRF